MVNNSWLMKLLESSIPAAIAVAGQIVANVSLMENTNTRDLPMPILRKSSIRDIVLSRLLR